MKDIDKKRLNQARLNLLHWVRDNKKEYLKYANKTLVCDKINAELMPILEERKENDKKRS